MRYDLNDYVIPPRKVSNNMLVSQNEIRSRIEQVKLGYEGYRRQLSRLNLEGERKERIETDVRLMQEELNTLETLAQFGRIEPDRDKIEAEVSSRLAILRDRMATDPDLALYTQEERDSSSGEICALQWSLGEDILTFYTQELMKGHDPDPSRTDRACRPAYLSTPLKKARTPARAPPPPTISDNSISRKESQPSPLPSPTNP